jgi:hypothetical protein
VDFHHPADNRQSQTVPPRRFGRENGSNSLPACSGIMPARVINFNNRARQGIVAATEAGGEVGR